MEFAFEFWKRIDDFRDEKGLTIGEIARAMDMKEQSVKNMRSECRYPKKPAIQALANFLGTSYDYLMTGRGTARGDESDVAGYLEGNAEAKAIVKAMMENPGLTEHLAAILKMMGK